MQMDRYEVLEMVRRICRENDAYKITPPNVGRSDSWRAAHKLSLSAGLQIVARESLLREQWECRASHKNFKKIYYSY